jgi:hypothetical protein
LRSGQERAGRRQAIKRSHLLARDCRYLPEQCACTTADWCTAVASACTSSPCPATHISLSAALLQAKELGRLQEERSRLSGVPEQFAALQQDVAQLERAAGRLKELRQRQRELEVGREPGRRVTQEQLDGRVEDAHTA